ncbi:MAG: enoyl-CoA hydratase/isomerase family protein [Myxococcales bacterium]|nr:enoyl-CoA hydratase/isomerase family protein [Myxococcales bacterium]
MVKLTLSGPGRNALSTAVMNACLAQLDAAGGQPLLLSGEGPAFSAGLNLKEVAALDRAGAERFLDVLCRFIDTLYRYPAPTVALVNGHAIAGGCVVAMACDFRIAAPASGPNAARMGLNEVALGLRFPPAILDLVRRRVPPQHLETVVLGAGLFPPTEALSLGLLDAVRDDAQEHARAALATLAAHPASAYAAAKRALRPPLAGSAAEHADFADGGLESWVSPELKARIAALLGPKK